MEEEKVEEKLEEVPGASLDDLLGRVTEKDVLIRSLGKKVRIKPIKSGDLADISKVAKGDSIELAIGIAFRGLVSPKMEYGQVRKLDPIAMLEIANAVSEHSGLNKEAVDRAKNLFTQEVATPSGS